MLWIKKKKKWKKRIFRSFPHLSLSHNYTHRLTAVLDLLSLNIHRIKMISEHTGKLRLWEVIHLLHKEREEMCPSLILRVIHYKWWFLCQTGVFFIPSCIAVWRLLHTKMGHQGSLKIFLPLRPLKNINIKMSLKDGLGSLLHVEKWIKKKNKKPLLYLMPCG